MTSFPYFLFLFLFATYVTCHLVRSPRQLTTILPIMWLSLAVRGAAVWINESYRWFEPKGASPYPMKWTERFLGYVDGLGDWPTQHKFAIQGLLQAPVSFVLGMDRMFLLLNNCLIGAMSGVVVYYYLNRLYGVSVAWKGLLLFTVFPGAFVFSIFGLRDVLIMFFTATNVLSLLAATRNIQRREWAWGDFLVYCFSVGAVVWLRPAMAVILALLLVVWVTKSVRRHMVVKLAAASLLILGYMHSVSLYTPLHNVSPLDLTDFASRRFERSLRSVNFQSNIVDYAEYPKLSGPVRYALQTAGILVVPMPWLLTSPQRMLAAVDSVFLIGCLVFAIRGSRSGGTGGQQAGSDTAARVLLLIFTAAVLAMGLMIVNGGNAFRMRVGVAPYLLIPAAIYLGSHQRRFTQGLVART